jgi:predicted amidophosphoribosyltransferase
VFFPAGCRLCDELLTDVRRIPICNHCLSSFQVVPPASCDLCGQPGTFDPEFPKAIWFCPDCQGHRFAFQLARSFGLYEGDLVRAILLLKHARIEPRGTWFADRVAELVRKGGNRMAADVVVPVPCIACGLGSVVLTRWMSSGAPACRLDQPDRPVLPMRSRPRPEKHVLGNDERSEAVCGAFAMRNGGRVDNLPILLLDDVMTTGATLEACSRALSEAGAKSLVGLTIAQAVGSTSSFASNR